jgi:hypothetical protein
VKLLLLLLLLLLLSLHDHPASLSPGGSPAAHCATTRQNMSLVSPPARPPMAYPGALRATSCCMLISRSLTSNPPYTTTGGRDSRGNHEAQGWLTAVWSCLLLQGCMVMAASHHHSSTLTITHHHSSTLTTTHHHSSTLTITHHHSSTLTTTHHHSSTLTTTHHHLSTLTITHHHSSPLITTHHLSPGHLQQLSSRRLGQSLHGRTACASLLAGNCTIQPGAAILQCSPKGCKF